MKGAMYKMFDEIQMLQIIVKT